MEREPSPYIIVRRHPYEEPDHTQLEFSISNGLFSGRTDIYLAAEDIAEIGKALKQFPSGVPDKYIYEHGSENPADNIYRYFLLRAYTTNNTGDCALQFAINQNAKEPNEGTCRFSIRAEPAAINRLGELLERFSKCEHTFLKWTLKDGELH
jgi:hypothetical protein